MTSRPNPLYSALLRGRFTRNKRKSAINVTDFCVFTRPARRVDHTHRPLEKCVPPPPISASASYVPRLFTPLRDTARLREKTQYPSSTLHPLSLPSFTERSLPETKSFGLASARIRSSISLRVSSSRTGGGSGRELRCDAGLGGKGPCERSSERRRQWHKPGEIREKSSFRQPSFENCVFPLFRKKPHHVRVHSGRAC